MSIGSCHRLLLEGADTACALARRGYESARMRVDALPGYDDSGLDHDSKRVIAKGDRTSRFKV